MTFGTSVEPEATQHLSAKISTRRDQVVFVCLCSISGFLLLVAFVSTQLMPPNVLDIGVHGAALGLVSTQLTPPNVLDIGVRGAALGLGYACLHLFQKKEVLAFPLIQRNFAYSLKIGSSRVLVTSVKLTVVVVLAVAGFIIFAERKFALCDILAHGFSFFIRQQIVFFFGAFCAFVCSELCNHFVQVVQTRRHVFAPPLGSTLAKSQAREQLLSILEDVDNPSLAQHLAYFDLCIVAESNMDTWRRTTFFEVTGETYKRIITSCLNPLDNLTLRLASGLEICKTKSGDFLKQQVQSQGLNTKPETIGVKEIFRDLQLCAWCARTVASLTSKSWLEDRFGVAQLSGCNKATLSSLLSCLLVVEFYLERSSSTRGFVGFVPLQGNEADVTSHKGLPFGKGLVMHKKAYVLADILGTSVYQIIVIFGDEMVGRSTCWKGVVERHWLNDKLPLYGTQDMHIQKLSFFMENQMMPSTFMGEFQTPVRFESGGAEILMVSPLSFDKWLGTKGEKILKPPVVSNTSMEKIELRTLLDDKKELEKKVKHSRLELECLRGVFEEERAYKKEFEKKFNCLRTELEWVMGSFEKELAYNKKLEEKLQQMESITAWAWRRAETADATTKRLVAEIEQLNRLADMQSSKMVLRFQEDRIRRLETLSKGMLSVDSYIVDECKMLVEELELMGEKADCNLELTSLSVKNVPLLHQICRLQEFCEVREQDVMLDEMSPLQEGLVPLTTSQKKTLAPVAACENELCKLEVDKLKVEVAAKEALEMENFKHLKLIAEPELLVEQNVAESEIVLPSTAKESNGSQEPNGSQGPRILCRSERGSHKNLGEKLTCHKWTLEEDVALRKGVLAYKSNWSTIAQSDPILKDLGRKRCRQRSTTTEFKKSQS